MDITAVIAELLRGIQQSVNQALEVINAATPTPTPAPTPQATDATPAPTVATPAPTPAPTPQATDATPAPTVATLAPTPAPTVATLAPTPAPTVAVPLPAGGPQLTREQYEPMVKLHVGYRAEELLDGIDALPQSYADHTIGDLTRTETDTGYREEIGIRTAAAQRWAGTFHPKARGNMIAQAKCSRWFPIHMSAADEPGEPIKPWMYPNKSFDSSSTNDHDVIPDQEGDYSIVIDEAHQPHILFDFAVLMFCEGNTTEFKWAIREMKFWCAWNYMHGPDHARGFSKGVFNPYASANQQRGCAWGMCAIFMLYFLLQKSDPWYDWCMQCLEENIKFLDGNFRTGDYDNTLFAPWYDVAKFSFNNPYGIMSGPNGAYGSGPNGDLMLIGAFQQAFHAQVWLWGYSLGLEVSPEVQTLFDTFIQWVGRWPVAMFGKPNDPDSWDYRRSGEYAQVVAKLRADGSGADFPATMGEMYRMNGYTALGPDDHQFRNHDQETILEGIATGYVDNIIPALSFAVDLNIPGAAEGYGYAAQTWQFKAGGSLPFAYLPRLPVLRYYKEDTPIATQAPTPTPVPTPVATPAPTPAATLVYAPTVSTFDSVAGTRIASEDQNFKVIVPDVYFYGANVPADVMTGAAGLVRAGNYFIQKLLQPGFYPASNTIFGDPVRGIAKAVFTQKQATTFPPAPTPVPTPVATVVTVAPTPLPTSVPGTEINPATWMNSSEGFMGRIPFSNTIRDCLPDFLKADAGNWIYIWPAFTYCDATKEIAGQNGGHMSMNMGATIYASLAFLRFEARNLAPAARIEGYVNPTTGLSYLNGYPDEWGVHTAMHGYNGYHYAPPTVGFPQGRLIMWTMYGDASVVRYYDISKKMGGGGTIYKTGDNPDLAYGGYGISCAVPFLGGAFVGDAVVSVYQAPQYKHKMAFIPFDNSPPQWGPPMPGDPLGDRAPWYLFIDQYGMDVLSVDNDRKYLYSVKTGNTNLNNGPLSPPILKVLDLDITRPTFNTVAGFALPDIDVNGFEPNRSGFTFLKGKGIVGIRKINETQSIGIQIFLGKNPFTDPPSSEVVYPNLPSTQNGVWNSHVAIDRLPGATSFSMYMDNPDSQPIYLTWKNAKS